MSEEVKTAVETLGSAFDEFKKTNDERLASLESKQSVDPLVETKLANIEKELDKYEAVNQQLTKAQAEQKNLEERVNSFETMMKRPTSGAKTEEVDVAIKSFDKFLRKGKESLDDLELKALSVSNDTSGGFLAPEEYVRELIKTITEVSPVRTVARIRSTAQKSIKMQAELLHSRLNGSQRMQQDLKQLVTQPTLRKSQRMRCMRYRISPSKN